MPTGDISGCAGAREWPRTSCGRWHWAPGLVNMPVISSRTRVRPDTSKQGQYEPTIISVHDSCLDYALQGPVLGKAKVACVVPTLPTVAPQKGQLYQRHALRFKCDAVSGFKFVPLLWPDSEVWPRDGEIDWPEADLDKPMYGYVHLQNGTSPNDQEIFPSGIAIGGGWHTTETIWSPGGVELKIDGVTLGNYTGPRIPDTPMHLCLQAETSTDGETPAAGAIAHILIDWVVVYAFVG